MNASLLNSVRLLMECYDAPGHKNFQNYGTFVMRSNCASNVFRRLAGSVVFIASVALASAAYAAPEAELWPRWAAHVPESKTRIDHSAWDRLLDRYVTRDGTGLNRFDYAVVTAADRAAFAGYLSALAGRAVSSLNRMEQRAYWINLYNALTVKVVLDHYPVRSIRDIDISPGWFADGPWGKKLVTVEGEPVGLDDIEHRILRPVWRDPRIHYAVNCASVGCPNLQRRAFTAGNTEALLDAAAREYVNSRHGARIDGGDLVVSSIYVWFQEDFGDSDAGVIAHLRRYAGPSLTADLTGRDTLDGHAYDWTLNGLIPEKPRN